MTMSPGERKFSNINFSMAEAKDFYRTAQFGSGDFVQTGNGKIGTERRCFGLEPRKFRSPEDDVLVADPFHNRFSKKTDRRIAVLEGFKSRTGFSQLLEQRLDLFLRRTSFSRGQQALVEHVQVIEGCEEFNATALVQSRRLRRRSRFAVAPWPTRPVEASLQARVSEPR